MLDRIIRAIRLEPGLYREVARSEKLMGESLIIVIAVAFLGGIGSMIGADKPVFSFIAEIFNSILFGWLLWSLIAYFVGKSFFNGQSSINELLRAIGYASAPRLLSLFTAIPCLGWLIALIGGILSLIAVVIAIRESMMFDTDKAIVTAIVGFVLYLMTSAVITLVFTGLSLPFQALF
ncbi:MAG: hypothetical protein CL609_03940 [Anaerolineaceae bacterium]|nr:hypothetical protein [Anaerolineaceae bacterium]